ncbi:ABC transporter ATP-binding protein [Peribacillus psychrosaccharolyticus]|uniref:ABC transporter ATP-binding protein n=1 Tax=Peribacillus psychrosaccharolyticus TaxID=1407 RepID=A0A974NJJ4_PERPY|nr:ABC transporter ATP-binding protein [Peribacillus psychrosaccharolyticus]MEC2055191.1 ABC transporter ATP-binding protein [Peribacillus psychrosaccharolyticus]MED3745181.1 ABC transporter ATP-binding protein [Peribacillus psychrosaccharolyticus]QQS98905.1 ABC transporter ATP-binding protein [Peribacillus psychrosaccharolyticus]
MISIKDGNFFYQKAKTKEQTYLYNNDISFDLHPGEIMSILGPNGAGKTTLLKCIMGLLKWEKGETLLNGKPLSSLRQKEIWRTIGYVPQASKMTFGYSILDLVTMGRALLIHAYAQPTQEDREAALDALELVGIRHLADQSCTAVSGGELQLALIARTLVSDPKILILDEPESHLDIQKQKIILQTIKKLVKERDLACIINTHYANHAFYFGDKVLMVAKNKPVITGSVSEIMTEENIFHYFDIEVKKLLHNDDGQVFETIVPKYFGLDRSDR